MERAADLLSTGRTVGAEEAKSLGLVRDVILSEDLLDAAIGTVSASAPERIRAWKRNPIPETHPLFRPTVPCEPNAVREAILCLIRGSELPLAEALSALRLRTAKGGDYAPPLAKRWTGWAAGFGQDRTA